METVIASITDIVLKGFDWSQFLAYMGIGLLGLGLSGSAIGLAVAGCAVSGMKDEHRAKGLGVSLLPGTQGIYSFVVAMLCMPKLKDPKAHLVIFACGAVTGIACLFSGWFQGVVCAAGCKSINQERMGVGYAFMLGVLPEFYALLSLVTSVLLLQAT